MRKTRRSVLGGIGVLTVGGGAIFGSGAFSKVTADRTVQITTRGDSSAYLGITVDSDYVVDGGTSDDVVLDFGGGAAGFNDDAVTEVNGAVTLANNSQDSSDTTVGFDTNDNGTIENSATVSLSDGDVEFTLAETNTDSAGMTLSPGDSVDVNVTVDTTVSNGDSDSGALTILAK